MLEYMSRCHTKEDLMDDREKSYNLWMSASLYETLKNQAKVNRQSLRALMLFYLNRGVETFGVVPLDKVKKTLEMAGIDKPTCEIVMSQLQK